MIDNTALKICSRCIYDEKTSKITFDEDGVCNYCKMMDDLQAQYNTGNPEGEKELHRIVEQVKNAGKNKKYDCIVGVSGGTDSSYMLYLTKQYGLRPLAVHYDNTWNTAISTENIKKVLSKLDIDLYTHVVDHEESDDIFKSFLKAGVPELDGPTDIAIAETLYRAANKFGVKYIFEGHSYKAEGVSPLGTFYVDGRYIATIHKKFGNLKMKTFPNMNLMSFMKWALIKRIKKIRPYWYIDYSKEKAREFLEKEFGWEYYGGHHLENRMTAFMHSYYLPKKFNIDNRDNCLSASVRIGELSREEALSIYNNNPHIENDLLSYVKKRLDLSDDDFSQIMMSPNKTYKDYHTYKKTFERLRPIFYVLAKANLVPMSFYIKYTSKNEL